MSRFVTLVLAGTSALALATAAAPAAPAPSEQSPAVTAGVKVEKVGGSWCC